jgi:hypothetical protein
VTKSKLHRRRAWLLAGAVCLFSLSQLEVAAGSCTPQSCNDGDPCTVDVCFPIVGCVRTPLLGACDDGDPTTCSDTCVLGICLGTPVPAPPAVDDSLRLSRDRGTEATLTWISPPGPYEVYRGSRAAGAPWAYDHACFAEVGQPIATDDQTPPAGTTFYYLVARRFQCRGSSVGMDSEGREIPNDSPCAS